MKKFYVDTNQVGTCTYDGSLVDIVCYQDGPDRYTRVAFVFHLLEIDAPYIHYMDYSTDEDSRCQQFLGMLSKATGLEELDVNTLQKFTFTLFFELVPICDDANVVEFVKEITDLKLVQFDEAVSIGDDTDDIASFVKEIADFMLD